MEERMSPESFELEPRRGEILRGDLWMPSPKGGSAGRAIVVCHGFKGFKDWGFFPHAARRLAERLGCPAVTFNFTGSGVGADLESFTERDAFSHNTFGKEFDDLAAVLSGLGAGELGELRFEPVHAIGVLGHSRGGVAAILAGELAPVRAVVTWAALSGVERYAEMFDGLPDGEPVMVRNARTGDVLPLHRDVAEDIRANRDRFDLGASLRRSRVPLLVVHGTADTSVAPDDGRRLAAASDRARLALIEGAGHTFEVGHPFEGSSPELDRALELTARHFDNHV
ncbi:MAG: alpha/beta hydrolase [Gemmatimonadota bacterium]